MSNRELDGTVTTEDGIPLRWWARIPMDSKGLVLVAHGFLEHSGRYEHVIAALNDAGFATGRFDCRGHGVSGGVRAYTPRYRDYLRDLHLVREEIRPLAPDVPLFLLGHSQGGLMVLAYALDPLGGGIDGVVSLSPAVGFDADIPAWKDIMGRLMSRLWPTLALDSGINPDTLTHVREAVEWRNNDPLIGTKATARWFTETLGAQARVQAAAAAWALPVLVMAAGEDALVDNPATKRFFDALPVEDKTWRVWDGMYHELLHETVQTRVEAAIVDWLIARVG
ncbi:MAG: lysophospholipase [Pseudomonadota bacterium]